MAFDESLLSGKYNLVKLSVLSSTQISSRTSAVFSNLQPAADKEEQQTDALATIVALTAKSQVGSKLITIAEIAKRELASKGVKCFQYNALSSEMIEIERKKDSKDADGDESDDAFETRGIGQLSATKKRKVPVMTIYLSTTSVRELKSAYGEQT